MKIEVDFEVIFKNKMPCIDLETNLYSKKDIILDSPKKNISLDLIVDKKDQLKISFKNKCDHEDNVIRLKKLKIDDIDLQHFIYEGKFYPAYNKEWYDKQVIKPPLYYRPGTEMRHTGVWILNITTPIWKMVMEQWLNDEGKNG